jgi:hypothetical protein
MTQRRAQLEPAVPERQPATPVGVRGAARAVPVSNAGLARMLHRAAMSGQGAGPLAPDVGAVIDAAGGGAGLPDGVQTDLEGQFGADFSAVRVHTGAQADTLSRAVQARAFTTGSNIMFRSGEYQPQTSAGRELLAHELTHVVQQATGPAGPARISHPDEPAEVQARAVAGGSAPVQPLLGMLQAAAGNRAVARLVQRQDSDDGSAPASSLDQQYQQALASAMRTGDFQLAAETLNGFNAGDVRSRLAELTADQIGYLHLGAVGNPRVGPQSQVAVLTAAGPVSTEPQSSEDSPVAAVPGPAAPAAPQRSVADMPPTGRHGREPTLLAADYMVVADERLSAGQRGLAQAATDARARSASRRTTPTAVYGAAPGPTPATSPTIAAVSPSA